MIGLFPRVSNRQRENAAPADLHGRPSSFHGRSSPRCVLYRRDESNEREAEEEEQERERSIPQEHFL